MVSNSLKLSTYLKLKLKPGYALIAPADLVKLSFAQIYEVFLSACIC